MKVIASILIIVSLFFLTVGDISAQTPSIASPSSPISSGVLTTLMTRLEAALTRADNINQRITSRLQKNSLKNQKQATVASQISKSKEELTQLQLKSQSLSSKAFLRQDYLLFREQVTKFIKNLKDIYTLELNIVTEMKKTATATPTIANVPTLKK